MYAGLLEVGFVITSGNILNLAASQLAGCFIDKMFIDEVDNEFCIRAGNKGFKILASETIFLSHKLGDGFHVKHFLTGRPLVLTKHSPLRVYYTVRNNLYIWPRFLFGNFRFVANRIRNILTLVFKIAVYFPEKRTYFKYIAKAFAHSLKGRYGKFTD
jgi:rhamnosyltransferase